MVDVTLIINFKGKIFRIFRKIPEKYYLSSDEYALHIPEQWIHFPKESIDNEKGKE